MAFDTFDEGIALGGLRSKHEIKILICYLFFSMNDRLTKNIVIEAVITRELANFFETSAAFDELVSDGNLVPDGEEDGEPAFRLTENGRIISNELENTLAYSVREKALKCALSLLSERKTAKENTVEIVEGENGYRVICTVSGGEENLLTFSMYAPDADQAELIKRSFLSYPRTVYKTMLALMTKDRENVGEALEEVYEVSL